MNVFDFMVLINTHIGEKGKEKKTNKNFYTSGFGIIMLRIFAIKSSYP
jgi:hypothetical protein